MHKFEIPQLKVQMEVPSEISELSQEDYLVFVELFLLLKSGELSLKEFRLVWLNHFYNLQTIKKLPRAKRDDIYATVYKISELFDSFLIIDQEKNSFELQMYCIKNLIPFFELNGIRYYGPQDALTDFTFFEYIDAHQAYADFISLQDLDSLTRLVAILYRPEIENFDVVSTSDSYDGQRRVKFNPHAVDHRMKLISELPFPVMYGIFQFYHSCEIFLKEGEFPMNGSSIKLKLLYSQSGVPSDDTGLVGILYTLSESGVFGNARETSETNLYDVMVRLYQLMQLFKNQEKSNKDGKN